MKFVPADGDDEGQALLSLFETIQRIRARASKTTRVGRKIRSLVAQAKRVRSPLDAAFARHAADDLFEHMRFEDQCLWADDYVSLRTRIIRIEIVFSESGGRPMWTGPLIDVRDYGN